VHAQEIYTLKEIIDIMKTVWQVFPLKAACVDLIRNAHLDVHSKVSGVEEDLLSEFINILI